MTRKRVTMLALLAVLVIAAGGGYYYYKTQQRTVPDGIVYGNGRIEADELGIATKNSGRVAEIQFQEGDLVKSGQVLARMDTKELQASEQSAAAVVAQRDKDRDSATSVVKEKQSQLDLAVSELNRGTALAAKDAVSRQRVEQLTAIRDTAQGALASAASQESAAQSAVNSAEAERQRLQHEIDDATLVAPKDGRILYKLADIGETLPAGGQVATLLDLGEVYMTVFLPSNEAARVAMNAPGRIVLDARPDRAIPGAVSFVAPRAQFTPKQVEVQSERERMMFRVKVRIPPSLVAKYVTQVKTGILGVTYIKTNPDVAWPEWLNSDLTTDQNSTAQNSK